MYFVIAGDGHNGSIETGSDVEKGPPFQTRQRCLHDEKNVFNEFDRESSGFAKLGKRLA
jgi:hypothetical protein